MATWHGIRGNEGLAQRFFVEHPRSLGMTWAAHAKGAVVIGVKLVAAGVACIVHAVVPGVFTETAGKTVTGMYKHMVKRRAGATNPEDWPEYEI